MDVYLVAAHRTLRQRRGERRRLRVVAASTEDRIPHQLGALFTRKDKETEMGGGVGSVEMATGPRLAWGFVPDQLGALFMEDRKRVPDQLGALFMCKGSQQGGTIYWATS